MKRWIIALVFLAAAPHGWAQTTVNGNYRFTGGVTLQNPCSANGTIYVTSGGCYTTISAAYSALPKCNATDVHGSPFELPCGTIVLPTGTIPLSTGITIDSPLVTLMGHGAASSYIISTVAECAITVDVSGAWPGPTIKGLAINGGRDTHANSCGIEYEGNAHIQLNDVTIYNFTRTGDAGLIGSVTSVPGGVERTTMRGVWLSNNTVGWLLTAAHNTTGIMATSGYGFFDMYLEVQRGQTGVESTGGTSTHPFYIENSLLHIIVNQGTGKTTCANINGHSIWIQNTGVFECDNSGSPARDFVVDGTSWFTLAGNLAVTTGLNTVASGGFLASVGQWDPRGTLSGDFHLSNLAPATSASNTGSNSLFLEGQYWNGSSSKLDQWRINSIPGDTGSDLFIGHSDGASSYDRVGAQDWVEWPQGYGGALNQVAVIGGGLGTNGISSGTITLSSGSGSHTFGTAYRSTPTCVATDNTTASAVKVTASTTSLAVAGSGSDVISWICVPRAN